jgi:hypothetical protein
MKENFRQKGGNCKYKIKVSWLKIELCLIGLNTIQKHRSKQKWKIDSQAKVDNNT